MLTCYDIVKIQQIYIAEQFNHGNFGWSSY